MLLFDKAERGRRTNGRCKPTNRFKKFSFFFKQTSVTPFIDLEFSFLAGNAPMAIYIIGELSLIQDLLIHDLIWSV